MSRLSIEGYSRAHAALGRAGLCTVCLSPTRGAAGLGTLLDCSPSLTLTVKFCLLVICVSTSTQIPLLNKALSSKKGKIGALLHYINTYYVVVLSNLKGKNLLGAFCKGKLKPVDFLAGKTTFVAFIPGGYFWSWAFKSGSAKQLQLVVALL